MKTYKSVNEYIASIDKNKQSLLQELRGIVQSTIKDAEESIAYGMPAYSWKGEPLFYFASMKGHLGLYPTPGPIITLKEFLEDFSTSKGCVRIPYGAKLPKTLIVKLLKERVKEIKSK